MGQLLLSLWNMSRILCNAFHVEGRYCEEGIRGTVRLERDLLSLMSEIPEDRWRIFQQQIFQVVMRFVQHKHTISQATHSSIDTKAATTTSLTFLQLRPLKPQHFMQTSKPAAPQQVYAPMYPQHQHFMSLPRMTSPSCKEQSRILTSLLYCFIHALYSCSLLRCYCIVTNTVQNRKLFLASLSADTAALHRD